MFVNRFKETPLPNTFVTIETLNVAFDRIIHGVRWSVFAPVNDVHVLAWGCWEAGG